MTTAQVNAAHAAAERDVWALIVASGPLPMRECARQLPSHAADVVRRSAWALVARGILTFGSSRRLTPTEP